MGQKVKQSTPSGDWFKNKWSYTSAPHICLYGVDRDNFTPSFSTQI